MKKNVVNVCVTVALVCPAMVVVFAWLGCVENSMALSMAAGAGFVVAVNCVTAGNHRRDPVELKAATAK